MIGVEANTKYSFFPYFTTPDGETCSLNKDGCKHVWRDYISKNIKIFSVIVDFAIDYVDFNVI